MGDWRGTAVLRVRRWVGSVGRLFLLRTFRGSGEGTTQRSAPYSRRSTPKFLREPREAPGECFRMPEVAAQSLGEVSVSQPWARQCCARQADHGPGGAQQLEWKTRQTRSESRICGAGRAALPGRPT